MDHKDFNTRFLSEVESIISLTDHLIDSLGIDIEVDDSTDGSLSIKSADGEYVVSRQGFLSEIWLSSPISGPHHFKYIDDQWLDDNKNKLHDLLKDQLLAIYQI